MNNTADTECGSDSEWLEVDSSHGTSDALSDMELDTDLSDRELESDSDPDRERPLSRAGWEGILLDDQADHPEPVIGATVAGADDGDVPPLTLTNAANDGAAGAKAAAESEADAEERAALDQSMVSTLSSRPHSVHSSLHDLHASHGSSRLVSSDLRLSFPDPLTSSRETHQSFQEINADPENAHTDVESELNFSPSDADLTLSPTELEVGLAGITASASCVLSDSDDEPVLPHAPHTVAAIEKVAQRHPEMEALAVGPARIDRARRQLSFAVSRRFAKIYGQTASEHINAVTILALLSVVLGYIVNGAMHTSEASRILPTRQLVETMPSAAMSGIDHGSLSVITKTSVALSVMPKTDNSLSITGCDNATPAVDVVTTNPGTSLVNYAPRSLSVIAGSPTSLSLHASSSTSHEAAGPISTPPVPAEHVSSALSVVPTHALSITPSSSTKVDTALPGVARAKANARVYGGKLDEHANAATQALQANRDDLLSAMDELMRAIARQTKGITNALVQLCEVGQEVIKVAHDRMTGLRSGMREARKQRAGLMREKREKVRSKVKEHKKKARENARELKEEIGEIKQAIRQQARELKTGIRENARELKDGIRARHRRAKENARNIVNIFGGPVESDKLDAGRKRGRERRSARRDAERVREGV